MRLSELKILNCFAAKVELHFTFDCLPWICTKFAIFLPPGLSHPALFVCVLQKVNSSQRLECHLFVCLNADDAIRMCSQMAELRQRASDIGKLHVPLAGQMGSYSYRSTPQPSSAASLISRSSNYAFSDLSSVTPKHNFSDIEEEDVSQQLSSLDSNTTSVTSSFAPNPVNGRMACDPR